MTTPRMNPPAAMINVDRRPKRSVKYWAPNAPKTSIEGKIEEKGGIERTRPVSLKRTNTAQFPFQAQLLLHTGPKVHGTQKDFPLYRWQLKGILHQFSSFRTDSYVIPQITWVDGCTKGKQIGVLGNRDGCRPFVIVILAFVCLVQYQPFAIVVVTVTATTDAGIGIISRGGRRHDWKKGMLVFEYKEEVKCNRVVNKKMRWQRSSQSAVLVNFVWWWYRNQTRQGLGGGAWSANAGLLSTMPRMQDLRPVFWQCSIVWQELRNNKCYPSRKKDTIRPSEIRWVAILGSTTFLSILVQKIFSKKNL